MTSPLPHAAPAAGFDHPLEMLEACHERIRRTCALIVRLAGHLAAHGVDPEARAAARSAIRYFETAGEDHHRDEEQDLFAAIFHRVPAAQLNAARALIARLREDHRELEAAWHGMRSRLAWVAEDDLPELDAVSAAAFAAAYERHIALEEAELLPLARNVLDAPALEALGRRMARRHGVPFSPAARPRVAA
jgi:hemerythrin-like domain-containing protein